MIRHGGSLRGRLQALAGIIVGTVLTGIGLAAGLLLLFLWTTSALR